MAAPVFDHTRRPVAAVAVAVPAYRIKSVMGGNAISLLKETAAKISARLHYPEED
jgi:DNA-binding IclR family transcriptional regulator